MPSIARSSIISGPAKITYNSQVFWSKGDVTLKVINERFDIQTSHFGKVDERFGDRTIEVTFEPSGAFTAGIAAVLWPYASTAIGASLFGATDVPLTINGRDGRQIVIKAAAVTKMPSIKASVSSTIAGAVTFTGLIASNVDPTNAAAYYTETAVAYPGDTGFAVSDILTKAFASAWGAASPWSAFSTQEGWSIDFNLKLSPQKVDGIGTVDMTFGGLDVSAKCIPVGPIATDILSKVAGTGGLGVSVATANHLNISATGIYLRLYNAALVDSGLTYGAEAKRISETEWIATRTITTGTADPLFAVGTSAPA